MGKILELSVLENQPTRTLQFLDITLDKKKSLFKNINQKSFEIPRVTLQKKEYISCDFPIDETDVHSYFFHSFLEVYVVQIRVLRLSKGLFRETYSNKKFTFVSHFAYQGFKLTAELQLTRKEILFILESLKLIKTCVIIYQKLFFITYPIPKVVKTLQQNSLFLHFFKIFKAQKPA